MLIQTVDVIDIPWLEQNDSADLANETSTERKMHWAYNPWKKPSGSALKLALWSAKTAKNQAHTYIHPRKPINLLPGSMGPSMLGHSVVPRMLLSGSIRRSITISIIVERLGLVVAVGRSTSILSSAQGMLVQLFAQRLVQDYFIIRRDSWTCHLHHSRMSYRSLVAWGRHLPGGHLGRLKLNWHGNWGRRLYHKWLICEGLSGDLVRSVDFWFLKISDI